MHQITHKETEEDHLAICEVVMWKKSFLDEVTTMILKLWAEDLTLVVL